MKPEILLIALLAFLNITPPVSPSILLKLPINTQNNIHPKIQVDLILQNENYDLFEYILPSLIPGISQAPPPLARLQPNLSLSFNTEQILFWMNKNTSYSLGSKTKYWKLKLQLTCKAPYFTKWRFNSGTNFENSDETREEQDARHMRYSVQLSPRDNEDPLQFLENVEKPTLYNLTSLTINWFSTDYKSGFIDCINPSNDTMKSRLYIFQRYGNPNTSPFTTNQGQNLSWAVRPTIPCSVHDPDIKPSLEYNYKTLPSWRDFSNSSFFRYHWKTGFEWARKNSALLDQFRQYKYRCRYKKIHTTPYAFEFNQESDTSANSVSYISSPGRRKAFEAFDMKISDIVKTKVAPFSNQNGAMEFLQFKCKLNHNRHSTGSNLNLINAYGFLLKSISVSSCVSPDYCFPSLISDAFSTVNCAGSVSPSHKRGQCELRLPFGNYVNRSDSDSDAASIRRQGRVTCFVEDANHKQERAQHFYFTGLSGKLHVLPTSKENLPLPLSAMHLNDIVHMHMNTTYAYDSNSLATVQLSCKSLKFFTFPSIKFSITYCNGTTELLNSQNTSMTIDFNGHVHPNYNYMEILMPLELVDEPEIYKFNCHVPLFNSTTWINVSIKWPGPLTGSELIDMDHLYVAFNGSIPSKNCSGFVITKTGINNIKHTTAEVTEIGIGSTSNYSTDPSSALGGDFEQDLNKAVDDDSAMAYEDQDQDTRAEAETTTDISQNTGIFPTSPVPTVPVAVITENFKEVTPEFDHKGFILGMSVAFVCVFIGAVVIIVLIAILIHRRRIGRLERRIRELTNAEMQAFFEGHAITRDSENDSNYTYALIDSQPFNRDFEIDRERLEIFHNKVLGSGEFGLVLYGMLQSLNSDENVVVAVKTVKPNVDTASFKTFLTELKVMCYVGEHSNIVSLLGAVTSNIQNREVNMALEFCAKGDLLGFLTKNRASFKSLFPTNQRNTQCFNGAYKLALSATHSTATTSFSYTELEHEQSIEAGVNTVTEDFHLFSTLELLDWARQVSSGMEFISSKKVVHGDLAARNVLLTAEKVAKISDFGLSRHLQNYTVYMKKTQTRLPWKWMAIESLRDMEFSVQSDVWAFGVTLYEIFSLGTSPYPGRNWTNQFVDDLIGGLRLPSPQFGNGEIYTLMMDCMKQYPGQRIKFPGIVQKLEEIKFKVDERFQL